MVYVIFDVQIREFLEREKYDDYKMYDKTNVGDDEVNYPHNTQSTC
jgi:hypothetical protein